ncbi:MAG: hypothetical protein GZ094_22870 [Mariniphaga sp.]|nr:hypothetical protein [Mariniphaga sp.]
MKFDVNDIRFSEFGFHYYRGICKLKLSQKASANLDFNKAKESGYELDEEAKKYKQ